ncbi:hypothetical protein FRX31_011145 [Thalictrum thalictroides]|uniref:Uncharacterized protein n=1 Tax=Thalictrum thalictroides TaxID=46969 RepID=A0A7J6WQR4_THATH|nr:hypothetical protein FRX31_011145 [Thalictrum thalictroides]
MKLEEGSPVVVLASFIIKNNRNAGFDIGDCSCRMQLGCVSHGDEKKEGTKKMRGGRLLGLQRPSLIPCKIIFAVAFSFIQ